MKKIILCLICYFALSRPLLAMDEDVYVQFVADSLITAHQLKGQPDALKLWQEKMQSQYPDFLKEDWQAFEERIAKDTTLKANLYNRILENIRAKGYKAYILELGEEATTIEIED